jgi:hypothetical protein
MKRFLRPRIDVMYLFIRPVETVKICADDE